MMFFRKKNRMTKLEKKEAAKLKKAKKDAIHVRKKVATTLDWMEVEDVCDDCILLKAEKRIAKVKGIKVDPHNIFLDEEDEQGRIIDKLRLCLNKVPCEMYFNFVYTPVNADDHISKLVASERMEEDPACQKMISDDLDKVTGFQNAYRELEFFVMVKEFDEKQLEKDLLDLQTEFDAAGFFPRLLNKRDYYNYLTYVFENPLINDYYFSRGVFTCLNQDLVYDAQGNSYQLQDETETFEEYEEGAIKNPHPEYSLIRRSRLAPTAFYLQPNYYILGDKYVTNILVTELPKTFYLGILCSYINDSHIKVFMTTERLDMNIAALLKKDYQEKQQDLWKTRDPSLQQRLTDDLASLHDYIEESIRNNDVTHNVTIIFSIYEDSKAELESAKKNLKQRLSANGFKTTDLMLMQEMVLRTVCPLFITSKLPNTIRENLGFPLPSDGVAGLYPFVFETLKDPRGFLLGCEMQNKGIILFDPFYYIHNKAESQMTQRINGNIILVGMSGSGKTTTMNLIIRDFIKNKTKIVWIDPENKNAPLTRRYGGTYVAWGQRNNIINVFDLKPSSADEEEDDDKMWDTELAIFNVIEDVNQVLSFLYPGISEDTLTITGSMVIRAYGKMGIQKGADGRYPSFKDLSSEDMPTFSTFNQCVLERIEEIKDDAAYRQELALLNDLKIKMQRIMNEWSIYFNGHTTVRFTNPERQIISFGTKVLFNAPKNLREALNHIMFKYSWTLCLNEKEESAFIIDEAHTMILEGSTAALVAQFYRRARKYHCSMVVGTQEPRDFADDRILTHGKAIFNNAAYKIIMLLKKDACSDVSKLVTLNFNETNLIQDFQQGDALFICGDRRIPIRVLATQAELTEMGAG
jgi:energy-coupling factor transporter ATP-binding protein EcfA2